LDISLNTRLARPVELGDAESLDVSLPPQTKFSFDFYLHGQSVRVPAGTGAQNTLAAHPSIPKHDVLDGSRSR
jgi:hypothetical protein